MIETLAGVSPPNTEDLLEEPSLADAAVVGVQDSIEPDDPAEPSAEEREIAR